MSNLTQIEEMVEATLQSTLPEVDLLEIGLVRRDMLRLVIDHPAGVDHDLCAAVTHALDPTGLRERFGVEVWSPGPERPLRTPEHFAAALGARIRLKVRTSGPQSSARTMSGELVAVEPERLRVRVGDEEIDVPMDALVRAHRLMEEENS